MLNRSFSDIFQGYKRNIGWKWVNKLLFIEIFDLQMLYMLFIDHIDVILLEGITSKFTLLDSKNYQFLCS